MIYYYKQVLYLFNIEEFLLLLQLNLNKGNY